MMLFAHQASDLFNYDQAACADRILLSGPAATSKVEYDEYVVFKNYEDEPVYETASHEESHITHRFSHDEKSGAVMLDLAFRRNFSLGRDGNFEATEEEEPAYGLEGRVRRVICFRRKSPFEGDTDMLSLTAKDVAALELHPATLQYATRSGAESRFWSKDRSQVSVILTFTETARTPCDFISLTYDVQKRSTVILVRQSWEPRRYSTDDLDEYDHRLESCRSHWAHPLIMPVILLQVQFMRCEEAVTDNSLDVISLESDVGNIAGFGGAEPTHKRLQRQLSSGRNGLDEGVWGPANMTNLMKKAHEVLRGSIKLLDTIRWMERSVKLLLITGDELSERMGGPPAVEGDFNLGGNKFGDFERPSTPSAFLTVPGRPAFPSLSLPFTKPDEDELGSHWHEIRQYLEGLLRLCNSLETDRRMSEARCRAQIDIIYSKMAQEDNVLNARMAVASSRDSSSMKALAVITCIFLPGEFIGTLFGMSMFDWLAPSDDDEPSQPSATSKPDDANDDILSRLFWVYWAISVPLTLFIVFVWRAWWVSQDRYFRRHLSHELSEERYWTADGKPRPLDKSFFHDFFYLSARREEKVRYEGGSFAMSSGSEAKNVDPANGYAGPGLGIGEGTMSASPRQATSMRQRQTLTGRQSSVYRRSNTGGI